MESLQLTVDWVVLICELTDCIRDIHLNWQLVGYNRTRYSTPSNYGNCPQQVVNCIPPKKRTRGNKSYCIVTFSLYIEVEIRETWSPKITDSAHFKAYALNTLISLQGTMAAFGRCYMANRDDSPSRDSIDLYPFLCFLPIIIHLLQSGHARAKSGRSMVDKICRFLHLFCGQSDISETFCVKGWWIQIICISRFHTILKTLSNRRIPLFLHSRRNGTEAQAHYRCANLGLRPVDRFTWVKLASHARPGSTGLIFTPWTYCISSKRCCTLS